MPNSRALSLKKALAALIVLAFWTTAANAQNPIAAYPNNYTLALENRTVAVIRVHYGPHEKVGVHDHSKFPTVYVYLNDSGPVRFEHFEEKPFTIDRPPATKGAYRISPGRIERHTVENLSDTSSDFLRIELKRIALKRMKPFRGPAPPAPLQSEGSIEFASPQLQIERIICLEFSPCKVKPSRAPSLLITFTPLSIQKENSQPQIENLQSGSVRWLPPSQAATIKPDTSSPAHLLRILLPTTAK